MTFRVVAKIVAREEKIAETRALLADLAAASREEDGCLGFEVAQDVLDPRMFITFERYRDVSAIEAHLATPHCAAAFGRVKELLVAPPDIGTYKLFG